MKRCAVETANPDSAKRPEKTNQPETQSMYPNQRTTNKRRRSRMNRTAVELAMSTCALLQSGGYQIIAANCINSSPRIIVEAQRGRRAGAFDPRAHEDMQRQYWPLLLILIIPALALFAAGFALGRVWA